MDPVLIAVIIVVLVPLVVVLALAKSASLRGPAPRASVSRKPIETLVTDAVPEERPGEDDEDA